MTGPIRAVDRDDAAWERLIDALEANAWFSPEFERAEDVEEIRSRRLDPDEIRGLEVRPDRD